MGNYLGNKYRKNEDHSGRFILFNVDKDNNVQQKGMKGDCHLVRNETTTKQETGFTLGLKFIIGVELKFRMTQGGG